MFAYKVIKISNEDHWDLYGLYETTTDDEWTILVMGEAPINHVFYQSIDELTDHIDDLHTIIQRIKSWEEEVLSEDDVMFVDMESESDEECEDGCGCEDGQWRSLEEGEDQKAGDTSGHHHHHHGKKDWCCGGGCGCSH